MIYCIVPRELAAELHDPLRRYFRDDDGIEVIVEGRRMERRGPERRAAPALDEWEPRRAGSERRRIRNPGGRRIGERRATLLPVGPPRELPRRLREHAGSVAFFERVEPAAERNENLEAARLVTRIQAGDEAAFSELYLRYFDRVYGYLRVLLRDRHDAEDATQQAFMQLYESIARYERRGQPFRAYLFVTVRNLALSHLRKTRRLEVQDPSEVERRREANGDAEVLALPVLDWISDRDLLLFLERLPLAQRQVLLFRYLIGLDNTEIAEILGRTPADVGKLHHRAMGFLRMRLEAVGRAPRGDDERVEWRRRTRRANVLRARRFSLTWQP